MTEFVADRKPVTVDEAKPSNGTSHAMPNSSAADGGDAAPAAMNGRDRQSSGSAHDAGADGNTGATASSGMKKRRKVNHACVYCRRSHMTCDSERPCTRCIKRNIGHLCHDEPREPTKRNSKADPDGAQLEDEPRHKNDFASAQNMPRKRDGAESIGEQQLLPDNTLPLSNPPPPVNPQQAAGSQDIPNSNQGIDPHQQQRYENWLGTQNQFQDIHSFHPSYMFNAPEVNNEYNLLNDFLSTSLLDDGSMFPGDDMSRMYSDMSLINSMTTPSVGGSYLPQSIAPSQLIPPSQSQAVQGDSIQRPNSTIGNDKAKETYYMTAADPSGTAPPEERMNKLLKAKYDAGLLKPFNYVNGYARLNKYMEEHLHPSSRQKILRQLDKFRPKFRERMQKLTDIELVMVEMWFERSLMEYDRVFASMAIPACCWRRTGQIFRGNQEMAQLIDVPIESLRDGKLAIHEIIVEDQLVSYWEKFGAIAFDSSQKAMLTSCTLQSPAPHSQKKTIPCCFSFTIRRDPHNIPSLIVGNFLPRERVDR